MGALVGSPSRPPPRRPPLCPPPRSVVIVSATRRGLVHNRRLAAIALHVRSPTRHPARSFTLGSSSSLRGFATGRSRFSVADKPRSSSPLRGFATLEEGGHEVGPVPVLIAPARVRNMVPAATARSCLSRPHRHYEGSQRHDDRRPEAGCGSSSALRGSATRGGQCPPHVGANGGLAREAHEQIPGVAELSCFGSRGRRRSPRRPGRPAPPDGACGVGAGHRPTAPDGRPSRHRAPAPRLTAAATSAPPPWSIRTRSATSTRDDPWPSMVAGITVSLGIG